MLTRLILSCRSQPDVSKLNQMPHVNARFNSLNFIEYQQSQQQRQIQNREQKQLPGPRHSQVPRKLHREPNEGQTEQQCAKKVNRAGQLKKEWKEANGEEAESMPYRLLASPVTMRIND